MAKKSSNRSRKRRRRTGRARTWWHPLLTQILRHVLGASCEVREEVSVGRMPFRLDIVVDRRTGTLPEEALEQLPAVSQRLNRLTIIEFTGPTDALEHGDFDAQQARVHLFRGEQPEPIDTNDMTLIILAPSVTEAFRQDVRLAHCSLEVAERGIHRLTGPLFTTWVIETDVVAGVKEPILSLFSRVFLDDCPRIIKELEEHGYQDVLWFVFQQIEQFRTLREVFAMQHKDVEKMSRVRQELMDSVLRMLPAEDRLRGISPEERMKGLLPEERLKGIPPDQILRALGREQLTQLENLLKQRKTRRKPSRG